MQWEKYSLVSVVPGVVTDLTMRRIYREKQRAVLRRAGCTEFKFLPATLVEQDAFLKPIPPTYRIEALGR